MKSFIKYNLYFIVIQSCFATTDMDFASSIYITEI